VRGNKGGWLIIASVIVLGQCIASQSEAMNQLIPLKGANVITEYEKKVVVIATKADTFFEVRNLKCNVQSKEFLSKSKRERVMVTETN
jgi:hypothetical protein